MICTYYIRDYAVFLQYLVLMNRIDFLNMAHTALSFQLLTKAQFTWYKLTLKPTQVVFTQHFSKLTRVKPMLVVFTRQTNPGQTRVSFNPGRTRVSLCSVNRAYITSPHPTPTEGDTLCELYVKRGVLFRKSKNILKKYLTFNFCHQKKYLSGFKIP